jgi:hypothetical protein
VTADAWMLAAERQDRINALSARLAEVALATAAAKAEARVLCAELEPLLAEQERELAEL